MALFDNLRGWFSRPVGPAPERIAPTVERANGVRVSWPAAPFYGSGDLGPPGEWQMRSREASDETLFAFGAVYACIQIISGDCGKLPVQFYDIDNKTGDQELNRSYPLNALFRRPNVYQNRMQFITALVISYLTTGNAYVYGKRDARNLISEMHVLDPRAAWPYVSDSGAIFYRCSPNILAGITEPSMIPARDMSHIRLQFSPSYPLVGVSPIFAAASSSAVGQRILYNTQQFFGNGAQPGGVLEAPGKISDDLAKRMREDFDQNYVNKRTGKTAVLGEGLTFKQLSMSAVDSQLIEQLRWSVEDIARVFRMPATMIGDQGKTTYRNSEQQARAYLNGCLDFHLSGIVEELNKFFELGASMTMAFDLSFLLRTETDVRFDANGKAINGGFMTPNEIRKREGLPPKPNGDKLLVQGAMRSLDVIVAAPATTGANPESGTSDKPAENADEPKPETEPGTEDEAAKAFPYEGVWSAATYAKGSLVTHDGGMWYALRATDKKPGSDAVVPDWKLVVKSGTNGRTPMLKLRASGLLEASYDGGKTWQAVGDMREMFKETVAEVMKGATNG